MPLLDSERDYEVVPVATGYDRWARVYDGGDNALLLLEEPVADALMGDVSGKAVLDLGCGTGRHALRLSAAGGRVTAFDFSEGMLREARSKPGAEAITFVVHDLAERLPLADGAIDRVICALVLEHVADLAPTFAEMRRVCRADGHAVITCMHPAMMLQGVLAHFQDPETGRDVQPRSVVHETSDFINAAIDAGWQLDRLEERAVDDALIAAIPRMKRHRGWPLLLAFRLR